MYGTAFTWEITPLVFTKSLEVIRGPGSALYGSNATNGVISFNTLSGKDMTKNAEVRFRAGSQNTQILDVLLGHEGNAVSFVSAFNYYQTKGNTYSSPDASATTPMEIRNPLSSFYVFNKIEGNKKLSGFSFQHHEQLWDFSTGHGWLFFVPDQKENTKEGRRVLSLRYKTPDINKKMQHEYLVRYQEHRVDWNVRLLPDNTAGYPFGLTELVKTKTRDVFSRAQWSYSLNKQSVILGGIENTIFLYRGDDLHMSNANLNTDFSPTVNNEFVNVGDYFQWLGDHPMINTGIFVQYTSPKLLDKIQATIGGRYDVARFRFNALDDNNQEESKSFEKFSPRVSIVYTASEKLSLKAMAGRAFRTPAPSELFGSNTYLLASNIRNLKPEVITTIEFGSDLQVSRSLNWRLNLYSTRFNDQIGYSVSNFNLSTNLYSLETIGGETEFLFAVNKFDGFLNYSYAQRVDEEIVDPTISISKNTLTWVPQHLANVGLKYNERNFYISMQSHFQGAVARRSSDRNAAADDARCTQVGSWMTVDLRAVYKPSEEIEIGLMGTNLFDEQGELLKNNLYSFDFMIPGRRLLLDLRLTF
jgi:iron complex outermembrane receptor protein